MKNFNLSMALSGMSLSESLLDLAPEPFMTSSAATCVCGALCEEECVCIKSQTRRRSLKQIALRPNSRKRVIPLR